MPRVRPTFAQPVDGSPSAFFLALARALDRSEQQGGRCRGRVFNDHAILRIRAEERRLWSPALHLHFDSTTTPASLHGCFSPSSGIWTAFIAAYLFLACVTVAAACYGYAQWSIGETPWALIGVPVALVLIGLTHGAAFLGQGLGAEDIYELRSFVDDVVGAVAE